ncbi:MAG: isoaspartyl peptidase/L-asparaginase [Chloroherpetonaceae bacterium]|nr:isoaspartyl peptidase/L-asparaginase [Chloroherpetonaceae bacterium]MDW8436737.1 isoaspartyl peptidase/L-asparaginase [Chloroherpetonaceae bacterium]
MKPRFAIAIHGGAGAILKSQIAPEQEARYRQALAQAVEKGYAILERGGSSLDAVQAVVETLEDDSLFNAGKGAVFNSDGKIELDAAIMDGATLRAGAVAALRHVKNPIRLARAVMEKSEHVLLIGDGAERFAKERGIELVDESYFFTEARWQALQKAKARESLTEKEKHGTVGAVALDQFGNLAAATSTGGMTNKKFGRIGDSPIIGAGTYADNETCAVSATGHGEYFIRAVVAHDIAALMRYKRLSLQEAAEEVVMRKLVKLGGVGGVIAIDRHGNIAMPFNSDGMYRASKVEGGKTFVAIYKDEK